MKKTERRYQRKKEKGVVLVLVALIFIPVFLFFCALVIDVGRMFILKRQMQNIADSAALVGVNQLYKVHPNSTTPADWITLDDWQGVKAAVGSLLGITHIRGYLNIKFGESWNIGAIYGRFTTNDKVQYGTEIVSDFVTWGHKQYVPNRLFVTLKRGVYCYESNGTKVGPIYLDCSEHSMDTSHVDKYCLTNLITVIVSVPSPVATFGGIMGLPRYDIGANTSVPLLPGVSAEATAHMRAVVNGSACMQPRCDDYFKPGTTSRIRANLKNCTTP